MRKITKCALASILIGFTVNLLVGCVPKSANSDSPSPAGTVTPAGQPAKSQGTSDSGGCNGINNKCFDSYIIDPTTLPAYKNVVQPLLENIKSADPTKPSTYYQAFKMKLWYLAPVDLESLKKEALGVSFVKSDIQQIAIQSLRAIWIDKRIFDKMNEQDQGELLLHEMVMSLYFVRFMTVQEICAFSDYFNKTKNEGCAKLPEYFIKAMAPEKLRPLTEEDNEHIRFVTAWILQNARSPVLEDVFVRTLQFQSFDKRFFNPDNYGEKNKNPSPLKTTRKEIFAALKASRLTGFLPEICTDLDATTSSPCQLEITEEKITFMGNLIPDIRIKISRNGEEMVSFAGLMFSDEVELGGSKVLNEEPLYALWLPEYREHFAEGDKVSSGIVFFRNKGSIEQINLVVESVVIRKGVIVSIDKESKQPVCQAKSVKSRQAFDAGFLVHQGANDALTIEQLYQSMDPIAICTSSNVQ